MEFYKEELEHYFFHTQFIVQIRLIYVCIEIWIYIVIDTEPKQSDGKGKKIYQDRGTDYSRSRNM